MRQAPSHLRPPASLRAASRPTTGHVAARPPAAAHARPAPINPPAAGAQEAQALRGGAAFSHALAEWVRDGTVGGQLSATLTVRPRPVPSTGWLA